MGKFTGRNALLMRLIGGELERLACRFGDDTSKYNQLTQYEAKMLYEMTKACKVGNLYSLHNIESILALLSRDCVNGRIENNAQFLVKQTKDLCEMYASICFSKSRYLKEVSNV